MMMLTAFPITTLALVLALLVYFALALNVGRARGAWNVPAPQSGGHPEFDKRYRVQMNTLEQLAMLVPGVIVAAPVLGDALTGGLALVWSLGRILFARAYYTDPSKRGPGFALTQLSSLVLLLAGAFGAITSL
ncbi:MAG: MAPEG family protein [Sphingomonadales bacterium]